ncbi:MAG: PTS glucose transporter subunit IIA [Firmicutes bacterium]|nr:PTS glucose transporter subunit IIA [Bacillota bacterium]
MDNKTLAGKIIELVGGKENVIGVVHCVTRLRFTLKDESLAKTDALKKIPGILSVVSGGGQYQIVIGPEVPQVYQEVISAGGFEASEAISDPEAEKADKRSRLSKILEGIASIFQPIIPAITGAGLLKALMALFSAFGVLKSGTQTYIILNAMADAAFYFMPILLAQSCARKFKCNQGTAMALAGILVYPAFISLLGGEDPVKFLSFIPITKATYTSSVIPIILGVWFMSYVEHFMQKISPRAIKFFSVPLVSLLIGGTVTIAVLGPIGSWVSNLINVFFKWLNNVAPWIVPTIVGIANPLLVMTGTHYGLIPIGTNNLATLKWDTVVGPGMLASNVAQGAAGFAVGLRSKNPDTKTQASSAGLTGVLGITEPVLYGVNLKFTFPLYAAMIGGGVGGLFLGITRVARFAGGSPGLLVLPAYIPNEEVQALGYTMSNLVFAIIGVVIAMVVAFIASFILFGVWAKKGKLPAEELGLAAAPAAEEAPVVLPEVDDSAIVAFADGRFIGHEELDDPMFKDEAMGQTVAIVPTGDTIVSPANGVLEMVFDTGHAFGVRMADGTGLLIHIGVDTVSMEGKGFTKLKTQGDPVRAGEPVIKVDFNAVKEAGYSTQTMLVINEPLDDAEPVQFIGFGAEVKAGQKLN